jgi:hypothetical protein
MTPREAAEQLLRDLRADLTQVHELRDLLEQQYQSALRHDAGALQTLGERIVACVEVMEGRRRVALAQRLAGPQARMEAVFPRLGQAGAAPVSPGGCGWRPWCANARPPTSATAPCWPSSADAGLLQPQGDLYAPA